MLPYLDRRDCAAPKAGGPRAGTRLAKLPPAKFDHSIGCKVFAEFVGTFFLVFVVGCNVLTSSICSALSIGGILMVMIYSLCSVSGAHFNPAVTVAIWCSQRDIITSTEALLYIVGQFTGGLCGATTYTLLFRSAFDIRPVGTYNLASAVIVEVLYTMALCYVVLNVTTTRKQDGSNYFGLAIGFTVVSANLTIGGISGCVLNPAIALSCSMVAAFSQGGLVSSYCPVYTLVPFIGSVLACGAFYIVQKRDEYTQIESPPLR